MNPHSTLRQQNMTEYRAWQKLHYRCENPSDIGYKNYGGRGIKVCKRWSSFANFQADMGKRPKGDYSIDRIDVDGDYEPPNCRWATRYTQSRNRTDNNWVYYRNKWMIITDAAKLANVKLTTIYQRVNAYGWSVERALSTPVRKRIIS